MAGAVEGARGLDSELLAACLGRLTLRSFPRVARVSQRWREAAHLAFAAQLRWRAAGPPLPLPLPLPPPHAGPPRAAPPSHIRQVGCGMAFLRGGDLAVQLVDAHAASVRTVCFRDAAPLEQYEAPPRAFADHAPFNSGVGGVVGYRQSTEGMAFFPISRGGTAASDSVWVVTGDWQNVLNAGKLVFLLRAHNSWWTDEAITADVLDADSGGRAVVDVTKLRDALLLELGSERPAGCAVSAADGHFIFHMRTTSGAKAAAALRLPAHIPAPGGAPTHSPPEREAVAFARRWPTTHAIARLAAADEKPCGEFLMLWEEGARHGCFSVDVVLLSARTGTASARALVGPAGGVAAAFCYGGIAAIDYCAGTGVVAACSLPREGLPAPAVLVWDWRSSTCLNAVLLAPQPAAPLPHAAGPHVGVGPRRAERPLRFDAGTRVEVRMRGSGASDAPVWVPGVVTAHKAAERAPYMVELDNGETCVVHQDHRCLIRAADGREQVAWNPRTQTMQVEASAALALHPSRSRLAIGLWRDSLLQGVVYSVDFSAGAVDAGARHAARAEGERIACVEERSSATRSRR